MYVETSTRYNPLNSEHVRRRSTSPYFGDDGKERILVFSRHIKVGEDVPHDGVCPAQVYPPVMRTQSQIKFRVLASHKSDVAFPDKDATFLLGKVDVPVDMGASFKARGVKVSRGASRDR